MTAAPEPVPFKAGEYCPKCGRLTPCKYHPPKTNEWVATAVAVAGSGAES